MSSKVKNVVNAATPVVKRDVNKWLYRVRQFLMLRDFLHNQRHEFEMAKRTQPQPHLPEGFAHKLNKNYYFERDARRLVGQPQVLFSNAGDSQLLTSGTAQQSQLTAGAASAVAPPASASPSSMSNLVSIIEAEKQTSGQLTSNKEQTGRGRLRTPGPVYNWDG